MRLPVLLLLIGAPVYAASPEVGKVVELTGTVQRLTRSGPEEVQSGSALFAGDRIRTEKGSRAILKLADDAAVLVKPDSEVVVLRNKDRTWTMELKRGAIYSHVHNPVKKKDLYRVKTRSAVMGVRGTTFYVESPVDGPCFICACHGTVAIRSLDGKEEVLIKSAHHDAPRRIQKGRSLLGRLQPAEKGQDHSDAEAAELLKWVPADAEELAAWGLPAAPAPGTSSAPSSAPSGVPSSGP